MKKFALLATAALAFALMATASFGNSGTNKTQFSVVEAGDYADWGSDVPSPAGWEDVTAAGQVVATRGKKNDPTWYSLSVTALGVPVTDDSGTPDETDDDFAIPYCLYDTAGGYPDTVLASGTATETGALKLDFGTVLAGLPTQVQVVRCDDADGTTLLISNSEITAPAPSTK